MAQKTILNVGGTISSNAISGGTDLDQYIAVDGYNVAVQDVDYESGRVSSGLMVRNRKAVKRKISVTFRAGLETNEIKAIHDAVKAAKISLTYFDPTQEKSAYLKRGGENVTKYYGTGDFYVGDRTFSRHSDALGIWSQFNIDFVEY